MPAIFGLQTEDIQPCRLVRHTRPLSSPSICFVSTRQFCDPASNESADRTDDDNGPPLREPQLQMQLSSANKHSLTQSIIIMVRQALSSCGSTACSGIYCALMSWKMVRCHGGSSKRYRSIQ